MCFLATVTRSFILLASNEEDGKVKHDYGGQCEVEDTEIRLVEPKTPPPENARGRAQCDRALACYVRVQQCVDVGECIGGRVGR